VIFPPFLNKIKELPCIHFWHFFSYNHIKSNMKIKKQKPENKNEIIIDMPEVKDIPGQEHIKPPRMREMMDSTPSSSGEEGEGILDDLNTENDNDITNNQNNVSAEEKKLLKKAARPVSDEATDLETMALDKTDGEDELNEEGDARDMGEDLDIPGSELDDDNEVLGEEDEENNSYSTRD
jgi:hypothetical protein